MLRLYRVGLKGYRFSASDAIRKVQRRWRSAAVLLASLLGFLAVSVLIIHRSTSNEGTVNSPPLQREQQEEGPHPEPREALASSQTGERYNVSVVPTPSRVRFCREYTLKVTLKGDCTEGEECVSQLGKSSLELLKVAGSCAAVAEAEVSAKFESGYLFVEVSLPSPTPCYTLRVSEVTFNQNSISASLLLESTEGICVQCLGVIKAELKLGPLPPGSYVLCIKPATC